MRFLSKTVNIIFVVIFFGFTCYGQDIKNINIKKYTLQNNLPSVNIRCISQDSFGYIWLGTQSGAARFNGRQFYNYSPSSSIAHKISGPDIRKIVYDSITKESIVLSSTEGLVFINTITNDITKVIPLPNHKTSLYSFSFYKYGDIIFLGTNQGFYIKKKEKDWEEISNALGVDLTNLEIRYIEEKNRLLYLSITNYGLLIYDLNKSEFISSTDFTKVLKTRLLKTNAIEIIEDKVYAATTSGLLRLITSDNSVAVVDNLPCFFVKKKSANELIFANASGLFLKNTTSISNIRLLDADAGNKYDWTQHITTIFFDNKKDIWVGTTYGLGVIKSNGLNYSIFYKDGSNSLNHVTAIAENETDYIVGLIDGTAICNKQSSKITILEKENTTYGIFKLKNKSILISTDNGLLKLKNKKLVPFIGFSSEIMNVLNKNTYNSVIEYKDNFVVLGSENSTGLYIVDKNNQKVVNLSKSILRFDVVNTIFEDIKANIWVLSDKEIVILNNQFAVIKRINIKDLPINKNGLFFDVLSYKKEYAVLVYGYGVIFFDTNYSISSKSKSISTLSDIGVYKGISYKDSLLVITTNNGLNIYNSSTAKMMSRFEEDGINNNTFEEVVALKTNENIIVGGINGFTVINNNAIIENEGKPKIYFESISITNKHSSKDTFNINFTYYKISNDIDQVVVKFIALDFPKENKTTYYYRIKQFTDRWVSLGSKNEVMLAGINPGKYLLEIKALNADGIESDIKVLTLIFLPKWHQTWWFKTLLVLAALGLGYIVYKIRVKQLLKEQKIKNNLAADLHDELGSTLTGLKVYSHQARKNPTYLTQLDEGIAQSMQSVREMIWALNDAPTTVADMFTKLAIVYKPLLKLSNIDLHTAVDAAIAAHQLKANEKTHLYLILKEAINNAMKYSQGSTITLGAQFVDKAIQFKIMDNGKGFDNKGNGYGLDNMLQRAKTIGYKISINSTTSGTSITIQK